MSYTNSGEPIGQPQLHVFVTPMERGEHDFTEPVDNSLHRLAGILARAWADAGEHDFTEPVDNRLHRLAGILARAWADAGLSDFHGVAGGIRIRIDRVEPALRQEENAPAWLRFFRRLVETPTART